MIAVRTVSVYAPASIGNFIVGFDCLGAALDTLDGQLLGDTVDVSAAEHNELTCEGPYAHALPEGRENNIVWHCMLRFNEAMYERELTTRALHLTLHKALPIGSGLGSSATSVVATLAALNAWYQHALDDTTLLRLCGELESRISGGLHYDNVAPSLRGGLQLMVPQPDILSRALPTPDWILVLIYPGIKVETKMARAVLPQHYHLADIVHFGERLAAFVQAVEKHLWNDAATLLVDTLIEPHRAALVPGFEQAKQSALKAGALAFSLSGSGPTCVAVCADLETARRVQHDACASFPTNAAMFSHLARIRSKGVSIKEFIE